MPPTPGIPSVLPAPVYELAPMRAVVGQSALPTLVTVDATGAPADASSVNYVVTAGDGAAITSGTAARQSTGTYTFVLPPRPNPDGLTIAWTWILAGQSCSGNQRVEVVGQRLVDIRTLQADPRLSGFSAAQLLPVMDAVEEAFDAVLGFPCVPKGERIDFWLQRPGTMDTYPTVTGLPYGVGAPRLLVPGIKYPISMIACQRSWTDITDLSLVAANGRGAFEYADGRPWPPGPYRVWVAHGFNPPPGELRQAAALLVRYEAKPDSKIPERAASITTEGSSIVIGLPTPDRPSGLPSVDKVLNRYRIGGGPTGVVI